MIRIARPRIVLAAKVAAVAVAFVLTLGTGWFAHAIITEPDCPTEDSCIADYREGGWHIDEIVP